MSAKVNTTAPWSHRGPLEHKFELGKELINMDNMFDKTHW